MICVPSIRRRSRAPVTAGVILVLAALPSGYAVAADLVGLYAGGSVGEAQVEANAPTAGDFKKNHSAFKVMVGLRPISPVGAELAYIDFGHPSGSIGRLPGDVAMKGVTAFGVLYLSVPVVDFFVKAGLARLQSTVNGSVNFCPPLPCPAFSLFSLSRTNTSFAAGAGAQLKFGSWALRAEAERFNAAGGNPGLASLGLTWTFL